MSEQEGPKVKGWCYVVTNCGAVVDIYTGARQATDRMEELRKGRPEPENFQIEFARYEFRLTIRNPKQRELL